MKYHLGIVVEVLNKIISTSLYPDILKIHRIVPIPKTAQPFTLDKYRPIAVLSILD